MKRPTTFEKVSAEVTRLYAGTRFAEALRVAEQATSRFPEHAQDVYWWRVCLNACLGDTESALGILESAMAEGLWFPKSMLTGDADLKVLQTMPAFKMLVAASARREVEAQLASRPELLILKPTRRHVREKQYPVLVALHGNRENATAAQRAWRSAANYGWLVATPQSSQVYGSGGFVWNDWERAEREVRAHCAWVYSRFQGDDRRLVIAGFSKGAEAAIRLAIRHSVPVVGFVAVAPSVTGMAELRKMVDERRPDSLRGYVIVGRQDTSCYQGAQALFELLVSRGVACRSEIHARLGHRFPSKFNESLARALDFVAPKPTD